MIKPLDQRESTRGPAFDLSVSRAVSPRQMHFMLTFTVPTFPKMGNWFPVPAGDTFPPLTPSSTSALQAAPPIL